MFNGHEKKCRVAIFVSKFLIAFTLNLFYRYVIHRKARTNLMKLYLFD